MLRLQWKSYATIVDQMPVKALYNGLVIRAFPGKHARTDKPVALTNRSQFSTKGIIKTTYEFTNPLTTNKKIKRQHSENAAQHCSRRLAGWASPGRRHPKTKHNYGVRPHSYRLCGLDNLFLRADYLDQLHIRADDFRCRSADTVKQCAVATKERQLAQLHAERWHQSNQRHAPGTHQQRSSEGGSQLKYANQAGSHGHHAVQAHHRRWHSHARSRRCTQHIQPYLQPGRFNFQLSSAIWYSSSEFGTFELPQLSVLHAQHLGSEDVGCTAEQLVEERANFLPANPNNILSELQHIARAAFVEQPYVSSTTGSVSRSFSERAYYGLRWIHTRAGADAKVLALERPCAIEHITCL